jgi:hypothetical protein
MITTKQAAKLRREILNAKEDVAHTWTADGKRKAAGPTTYSRTPFLNWSDAYARTWFRLVRKYSK